MHRRRRRRRSGWLPAVLVWLVTVIILMLIFTQPGEAAPTATEIMEQDLTQDLMQRLHNTAQRLEAVEAENEMLWAMIKSTKDYRDLAGTVEQEAKGEGYEGKLAVAEVIVNRTKAGAFGDTIHDVLYAPGQFTPVMRGTISREVSEETFKAVDRALTGQTHEALYFMNPDLAAPASRGWMRSLEYVTTIGNHEFYK